MLLIKQRNNNEPSTVPWGTPKVMGNLLLQHRTHPHAYPRSKNGECPRAGGSLSSG